MYFQFIHGETSERTFEDNPGEQAHPEPHHGQEDQVGLQPRKLGTQVEQGGVLHGPAFPLPARLPKGTNQIHLLNLLHSVHPKLSRPFIRTLIQL